jgi:hypothetical protein
MLSAQAFVFKYLIFFPIDLDKVSPKTPEKLMSRRLLNSECIASNIFFSLTEERRAG